MFKVPANDGVNDEMEPTETFCPKVGAATN